MEKMFQEAMQNQFKLLIELQAKDLKIDELTYELEKLPKDIEALKQQLEQEKHSFETFRTEGKQFTVKHKEKEGELSAKENEIIKFGQELNSIKTNEAYKAMLTQIDDAKKQQSSLEDEILELLEKSDQFNKQIKNIELQYKEKEVSIQQQISKIEDTMNSFKTELAALQQERESFVTSIPGQPLHVYEHIRKGKDGLAIVPIDDNTSCSGCHYKLTPQRVNEAAKMKDIIFCDNCSRIVYYVRKADQSGDTKK